MMEELKLVLQSKRQIIETIRAKMEDTNSEDKWNELYEVCESVETDAYHLECAIDILEDIKG